MGGLAFAVLSIALVTSEPALADRTDELFEQGNEAFNDGDYERAKWLYIRAIQYDPIRPIPYLYLADTYYVLSDYDMAVIQYDFYLGLASEDQNLERAKARRGGANKQRTDPQAALQLVSSQADPLAALQALLQTGPFLTSEGGGAWALYVTLLRSGYASPKLIDLQELLLQGLLGEAEGSWAIIGTGPMPLLSSANWDLLARHYEHATQLGFTLAEHPDVQANYLAAKGFLAYFNQSYERASAEFQRARDLAPSLEVAWWGILLSHFSTGTYDSYLKALEEAQTYDQILREEGTENIWLPLYLGLTYQAKGDSSSASAYFHRILYPEN